MCITAHKTHLLVELDLIVHQHAHDLLEDVLGQLVRRGVGPEVLVPHDPRRVPATKWRLCMGKCF